MIIVEKLCIIARMNNETRFQVAKRTSYVNAFVNTLLAILKIIVGSVGNSAALVADGIHSFSDLISDGLVLIASKAGTKHPDEGHPYGHQRIETIAAIIIAFLFLIAGAYIIYDAIIHILNKVMLQKPNLLVAIIAAISVIANEWLFRYTLKKGKSVHSNLLITNAWHNRSDVYVSLIVLVSVALALFGLHYFDAIGAAIIALFIVKMGLSMIWTSINELIDAGVDETLLAEIHAMIQETPGVQSIHQLRTRMHGGNIFVDVHILVDPKISVSEGHYISEQVNLRLLSNFSNITDVTTHIDPEDDEKVRPSIDLPSRAAIRKALDHCWKNLPAYSDILEIQLHYLDGKLQVELVLPLQCTERFSAQDLKQQYHDACNTIKDINGFKLYFV